VELRSLQERWDAFARRDAFGAILAPMSGRESRDVEAFLASGRQEIDEVLAETALLGLPTGRTAALDFGCGAGRLTQALAARFDGCLGVDISPRMIALARQLNQRGARCRFLVNAEDSLAGLRTNGFDFVYSNLVLQHLPPGIALAYVAELARVLAPGGALVFQTASEREATPELPWSAFCARIEHGGDRLRLAPGERRALRVVVANAGDVTWPAGLARHRLALGNRWRTRGTLAVPDDGRVGLPADVAPGALVELELVVTAPESEGEYELELDLVQEGVAWFSERGSTAAILPTRVEVGAAASRAAPASSAPPATASRPHGVPSGAQLAGRLRALRGRVARGARRRLTRPMEMYALPREQVVATLAQAGVRLIDVVENDAAGPGWISLRYTATKDEASTPAAPNSPRKRP
jgi:SAM-dependent methyltransferase